MITVQKAEHKDLRTIHDMAQVVFRHTYKEILSSEQMEYMMSMMEMVQMMNENASENSEGFNPMDMFSDMFHMKGDYNNE